MRSWANRTNKEFVKKKSDLLRGVLGLISFQRFCSLSWFAALLLSLICASIQWSAEATHGDANQFFGIWQRVYDECGDWKPAGQQEVFERARDFVPYRETTLIFDEDKTSLTYTAEISPSRACNDLTLRSHSPDPGCSSGVNRGEFWLDDGGRKLVLQATERIDYYGFWGGNRSEFSVFMLDGMMVLTSTREPLCPKGLRSFYYFQYPST